jgi:hypothetical protein
MYTAKIIQKIQEPTTKAWIVDVEFSNGTDTFIESIKPQDRQGFDHWLQSRLKSLNGLQELIEENNLNKVINLGDFTDKPLTQSEIDRNIWFENYYRLERLEILASKGFLTGVRLTALTNKITTIKDLLDQNVKVEYLDFI